MIGRRKAKFFLARHAAKRFASACTLDPFRLASHSIEGGAVVAHSAASLIPTNGMNFWKRVRSH
jgi:hypothetical protein